MLDPKEFLEQELILSDYMAKETILANYRTHIIQSIIQDLSIQRNVSPELLEYLKSKL